ncbi:glycosyltransferase family protein [Acinetobacter courvalinii]|uniref:hypothetical protein n=1 Tax=Acinetobacter courvalinii TaxID=280147 RepID=UPI001900CC9E|nr:hypothetical protein [Acinetobacter courvalinii]MBJ9958152.1 hypothetical protein [Acinetobacter courvalinii]
MVKNIIFHCPFPLDYKAKSASGIRPIKILQAFYDLGFNVDLVVGYSDERALAIKNIKKKINNGYQYSFVYSESSTMPTALTDPHHLPLKPFLDFNFFSFLKKKNIKIGLFYRDIYWMFEDYGKNLPWYKKQLALFFYRFDLKMYNKLLDKLYLPSLKMGEYIKISNKNIIDALPPAHSTNDYRVQPNYEDNLNLLYIGGMGTDYKMHKLFEALKVLPNISLTLCTRENDWASVKDEYGLIPDNIHVVHKSGNELENLYDNSHLAVLFVEPRDYREFAVPFKLYEYIGRNKPIICTSSTLVGNFVEDKDIGWALEYNTDKLINLLSNITKEEVDNKIQQVLRVKENETWESRAKKVCTDLGIKL